MRCHRYWGVTLHCWKRCVHSGKYTGVGKSLLHNIFSELQSHSIPKDKLRPPVHMPQHLVLAILRRVVCTCWNIRTLNGSLLKTTGAMYIRSNFSIGIAGNAVFTHNSAGTSGGENPHTTHAALVGSAPRCGVHLSTNVSCPYTGLGCAARVEEWIHARSELLSLSRARIVKACLARAKQATGNPFDVCRQQVQY